MKSIDLPRRSSSPQFAQTHPRSDGAPGTPARTLKSETHAFGGACRVQVGEQGHCVTFAPPNHESDCVRAALVDALAALLNAQSREVHRDSGATTLTLHAPVDEATVWRAISQLDRLAKMCQALGLGEEATAQVLQSALKEPALLNVPWLKNARALAAGKGDANQALEMARATMAHCPALAAGLVQAVMRRVEAAMNAAAPADPQAVASAATQAAEAERVLREASLTPELLQQALSLAQTLDMPGRGLVITCSDLLRRLDAGASVQAGASIVSEAVDSEVAQKMALDIAVRLVKACGGPEPSPEQAQATLDDLIELLAQCDSDAQKFMLMEIRTALVEHLAGIGIKDKDVLEFGFQFSAQTLEQAPPALLAAFATIASLMDDPGKWSALIRQLIARPASWQQKPEAVETLLVVLQTSFALNPHGPSLIVSFPEEHGSIAQRVADLVRKLVSREALQKDPQLGFALMLNALVCAMEPAHFKQLRAVMSALPPEWLDFPNALALIDEAQKADLALHGQGVGASASERNITTALLFLGLKCALQSPATGQRPSVLETLRAVSVMLQNAEDWSTIDDPTTLHPLWLAIGPAIFAATPSEDLPEVFDLMVQFIEHGSSYPMLVASKLATASHSVDVLVLLRCFLVKTDEEAASLVHFLDGIASPAVIEHMRAVWQVAPSEPGGVVAPLLELESVMAIIADGIIENKIPMPLLHQAATTLLARGHKGQGVQLAQLLAVITALKVTNEKQLSASLRVLRASGTLSSDVCAAFSVMELMDVMNVLVDSLVPDELEALRAAVQDLPAAPVLLALLDVLLADGVQQPQILAQGLSD